MDLLYVLVILVAMIQNGVCSFDKKFYVDSNSANTSSNCSEKSIPCSTLELGLSVLHNWLKTDTSNTGTLLIHEGTYDLTSIADTCTTFEHIPGVTIEGWSVHNDLCPVTIACASDTDRGFYFFNSTNITLRGIAFIGCGQSNTFEHKYLNNASLYFFNCTNIKIERVQVLNTLGFGCVIYNSVGYNNINESNFTNNSFVSGISSEHQPMGGGLFIKHSYCNSMIDQSCHLKASESNVDSQAKNPNATFAISNTTFANNLAHFNASAYKLPIVEAPGYGGGLSIHVDASNIKIAIKNCTFINNSGARGGGMLLELHDNSQNNSIVIEGCTFSGNWLKYTTEWQGGGGGGARVSLFMFSQKRLTAYNNSVVFINCKFSNNSAYYGGGLSVCVKKNLPYNQNKIEIHSCNFTSNIARLGAAMDLSLLHSSLNGSHPNIRIVDCSFRKNHAHKVAPLIGIGSIYIDSLPATIGGQNTIFEQNKGSALAIAKSYMTIEENSTLVFLENTGISGAAIVFYSGAFIVSSPGSFLNFTRNKADFFGGAIQSTTSGERAIVSSGDCFVRYSNISVEPQEWTSHFVFDTNIANNKLNAISASSILPCVWGGYSNRSLSEVFCWNKKWIYKNATSKTSCPLQITSAASHICNQSSYSFFPGHTRDINITVADDMKNDNTEQTVFLARIIRGNASFAGRNNKSYDFTYISHNSFMIQGEPNTTATVQFITGGPNSIEDHINITILPCPPGFISSNEQNSSVCVCDDDYGGVTQCDRKNFTCTITRHAWIGKIHGHDGLVYGSSPFIIRNGSTPLRTTLPSNPNDLDTFFCNETHSTGILCGTCQENYGVAVNGLTMHLSTPCVHCPEKYKYYNWLYYILLNFLPVTIFFGIVFIFSMTVTFGPLNSFIFYAQMITSVMIPDANGFIPYDGVIHGSDILMSIYNSLYGIWNLNFFPYLTKFFCLSPHLKSLDVLCLKYIEAVYPLLLLTVFVSIMTLYNKGVTCVVCLCRPFHRCLARFRQLTNMRQSLTGGMAVFIVISYTKFTLVSLTMLAPETLYTSRREKVQDVFYYCGDINYGFESIRYILTAVVVLCVFGVLPPFLLLYPSLLKLLEWLTRYRLNLSRLYPHTKLQAFLDEFHGCYRDGTDGGMDCRWFAGFYFLLRLSLSIIFAVTVTGQEQYTIQVLLFLFCSFLFLTLRPYRKSWINQVDATIFLIMTGISATSMYNLLIVWVGNSLSITVFVVQYVLILLPLIYCIGYCFVLICSKCKDNFILWRRLSKTATDVTDTDSQTANDESLVNSSHVPEFLDYVADTGRMKHNVQQLVHNNRWRPVPGAAATINDDETRPLLSTPSNTQRERGGVTNVSRASNSAKSFIRFGLRSDKIKGNKMTTSTVSISPVDCSSSTD